MKQPRLRIVKFKTDSGNQYIYDSHSNRVFYCPPVAYEILRLYQNHSELDIKRKLAVKYPESDVERWFQRVDTWITIDGAFYPSMPMPEGSAVPTEEEYWEMLRNHTATRNLYLVVTEACNLRCSYCAYGGTYEFQRDHGTKKDLMDFETARKSIDYFLDELVNPDKMNHLPSQVTMGFYGGEPLIHWQLIKQCMEYARSKPNFKRANAGFSITTNGTLFTDEIIDSFAENRVAVALSLDGPEEVHDRLRQYSSGKGSWAILMKNLAKIRNKYPDYFKERFMASCVYDWGTDFKAVDHFFTENADELPLIARYSAVSTFDTTYYDQFTEEDKKAFAASVDQLRSEYSDKMRAGKRDGASLVSKKLLDLSMMVIGNRPQVKHATSYTAACPPGERIAVHPDGTFHICEKLNTYFPIGDCDNGIQYERIREVLGKYNQQVVDLGCQTCVARKVCTVCFATTCQDGNFSTEDQCKIARRSLPANLAYYYSILEENPEIIKQVGYLEGKPTILDKYY